MKVWITKFALTKGVFTAETTAHHDSMIVYRRPGSDWDYYAHGEGKEWHRTEDSACARVEAMIAARMRSLKAQIKRLETVDIKVPCE